MSFNVSKTKSLLISNKTDRDTCPCISINNVQIEEVVSHKHLGVPLTQNLSWSAHINEIAIKASQRLNIIQCFKFKLSRSDLEKFYLSFVLPILEYCDALWDGATAQDLDKLDRIHLRAMRIITGATERTSSRKLLVDIGWNTLETRRKIHRLKLYYKILKGIVPSYLFDLVPQVVGERNTYALRNRHDITLYRTHREFFRRSFFPSTTRDWNELPLTLRNCDTINSFSRGLANHFARPPKIPWYGIGDRKCDVYLARMRLECSSLKAHLHFNLHVEDSPRCACGFTTEDPEHYLLHCPLFEQQRILLTNKLSEFLPLTADLLLYGRRELSDDSNNRIVFAVQSFIQSTHRFH